jgi:hypothetical protein
MIHESWLNITSKKKKKKRKEKKKKKKRKVIDNRRSSTVEQNNISLGRPSKSFQCLQVERITDQRNQENRDHLHCNTCNINKGLTESHPRQQ